MYQWAVEVYRKRQEAKRKAAEEAAAAGESDATKMLQDPLMDGE